MTRSLHAAGRRLSETPEGMSHRMRIDHPSLFLLTLLRAISILVCDMRARGVTVKLVKEIVQGTLSSEGNSTFRSNGRYAKPSSLPVMGSHNKQSFCSTAEGDAIYIFIYLS
jgi:hypothetical protein